MNEEVAGTPAENTADAAPEYVGAQILCDKHGDVTKGSLYLHYGVHNEQTGQVEENHFIYCVKCLNEYLADLQKKGILGNISVRPIKKGEAVETDGGEVNIQQS